VAAVDYRFPWDALVRRFKYAGDVTLAPALAAPMVQALRRNPDVVADLVLPIPLASARLRERGFNQAWELARRIAGPIGVPADASLLQRRRETPSQVRAAPSERLANMRAAFAVGPRERTALRGRRVLLVDDVMTTGATLAAATQALLEAGAADVQACVFARTPRDALDGA
jgi:ComF family protein